MVFKFITAAGQHKIKFELKISVKFTDITEFFV